jgi:small subunit ribosomal protein S20
LANTLSAKKRARQNPVRRLRNSSGRSMLRTSIKNVTAAIQKGDKKAAAEAYKAAVPVIDSARRKGLIHANKAARHKSRLNTRIRAMP